VIALTLAGLVPAYFLKIPCTTHEWDGYQYRRSCYNDIYALYSFRGLAEGDFPYIDTDLEYPVGTGLFMGAASAIVGNGRSFFDVNAVGLGAFALAGTAALWSLSSDRRRLLAWAAAPSMILYAFHNWDLIAVGLMTLAVYAFYRHADRAAGVLAGMGAAAKLFPGLLVIPFFLTRRADGNSTAWRSPLWAVAAFAAVNLPILILSPDGWWFPWSFQGTRFPNFENVWYFVYRHAGSLASSAFWFGPYTRIVSALSGGLFLVASLVLVRAEARRPRVRPLVLAFGMLCLFLLTSKVFSPQYALWLLPFFVLLDIPLAGMGAFFATDAAVWFGISAYFLAVQHGSGDPDVRLTFVEIAVFARYAVIAWLLYWSRRARELVSTVSP
jgi:uncharacterized membrane protein